MLQTSISALFNELKATDKHFALVCKDQIGVQEKQLCCYFFEAHECQHLREKKFESDKEYIVLLPYQQLKERGLSAIQDEKKCIIGEVTRCDVVSKDSWLKEIRCSPKKFDDISLTPSDEDYAKLVDQIQKDCISEGEGANFVIKRSLNAKTEGFSTESALNLFSAILSNETGAHWTFLLKLDHDFIVGASPERHVTLSNGILHMTPISGTLPIQSDTGVNEVVSFLQDKKEIEELNMVLDEELKMMSSLCSHSVKISPPSLRVMGHVIHTQYDITGFSDSSVNEILLRTMFAPTVTGSPVINATRVVSKYETTGRGYYSGVLAIVSAETKPGLRDLDSCILIRTAEITEQGELTASAGSTIVKDSVPYAEAEEVRAKLQVFLSIIEGPSDSVRQHESLSSSLILKSPDVVQLLRSRNSSVSKFWQGKPDEKQKKFSVEIQRKPTCLLINAEDEFTDMLSTLLESMGIRTTIASTNYDQDYFDKYSFVLFGPGPGDPNDDNDRRIAALRSGIKKCLLEGIPILAICLSHQILSQLLGMQVVKLSPIWQGQQKKISFFGRSETVGFYNSFIPVDIERDGSGSCYGSFYEETHDGYVIHISGEKFESCQFHPESVLTINNTNIITNMISHILG